MGSRARLKLARLADLEQDQQPNTFHSAAVLSKTGTNGNVIASAVPLQHQHVGQIMYDISADSPLNERLAFWAFKHMFRFFKRHFNFIVFTQERQLDCVS